MKKSVFSIAVCAVLLLCAACSSGSTVAESPSAADSGSSSASSVNQIWDDAPSMDGSVSGNDAASDAGEQQSLSGDGDIDDGYAQNSDAFSVIISPSTDVSAVLNLVNSERAKAGVAPVTLSIQLCEIADIRAEEAAEKYSHTRPDGSDVFSLMTDRGISYRIAGENIAAAQLDARTVMRDWMASEKHRENILNAAFTEIGISIYFNEQSTYGCYWVQIFRG